ncbi:Calponin_homology domain-containing protein [Hexamita inflata]|uniref:Calponin homology domain-containing protein n=1 Tax=Hexamita inflata TaxID=28002 RepID=A0AA86QE99_9EUKA|nr:Calponin homology domain-containing protein [Hexamita inflata]
MNTIKVTIHPCLLNWYNSLKLPHIEKFRHDLHSGWIVAHVFNKVFGESFELRTFTQDTSIKNSRHNWTRIIELQAKLKLPTKITPQMIDKIVLAEDEQTLLDIMIELYEQSTKQVYPRVTYQQIASKPRQLQQVLPSIQNISLQPSQVPIAHAITPGYPQHIPQFCRSSYVNARRLIDHLSSVCRNSITQLDDIRDYIEMLDPRADLCFPFPQLLLRLPGPQYCSLVCRYLVEHIDVELVSSAIIEDYLLFYDFSKVMIHSVIALNQLSGAANELFDLVTDHLCYVLQNIRRTSEDVIYLVLNNIIMNRLLPEIPLINFSLVHFYKICLACTSSLTPQLFNSLINSSLTNLKAYQPTVSENRLRFEILIAFTILAQQLEKYRDQIARTAVRFSLHGALLKDSEKFVALDLMCRCVVLSPEIFSEIEFQFFRLINVIVNKIQLTENTLLDFENKVQIKTNNGPELEFIFDKVSQLNFEQVLFLSTVLSKLEQTIENTNITEVAKGLELRLIEDDVLPPCHFYIGIASILKRNWEEIIDLNEFVLTKLNENATDLVNTFQEKIQEMQQIRPLLVQVSQFLLQNEQYIDSVFSLLHGLREQEFVSREYMEQSGVRSLNHDLKIGSEAAYSVKSSSNHIQHSGEHPLPQHIFGCIAQIFGDQRLDILSNLFVLFLAQHDITMYSVNLIYKFLTINNCVCEFVYIYLNEQLFSAVLQENDSFSESCVRLLMLVMVLMYQTHTLPNQSEDIRTSLQALIDCCFGYQRGNNDQSKRIQMQEKCLRLLNELKTETHVRVILVEMFEKMDYETFGNDQLEKLISEIAGDV